MFIIQKLKFYNVYFLQFKNIFLGNFKKNKMEYNVYIIFF
jgi:hypothetical protein